MKITKHVDLSRYFSAECSQGLGVSNRWLAIETLIVFTTAFCTFTWTMAYLPGFRGIDGFYNIFMARQILEHGPWVDVNWLPFTVLGKSGLDHAWFFHVIIAPFAFFDDPTRAFFWAAVTMGASVPAAMNVAGRFLRIPYSPLFALLTVCAALALPFRFLILRPHNIGIIFMFLGLVALFKHRLIILGLITFLFMQSYQAVVIMGVLTTGYIALVWVHTRKTSIWPLIAVMAGITLGLALSPWFPENLNHLLFHTTFKTQQSYINLTGGEWRPVSWPAVAVLAWIAHLLVLVGLITAGIAMYRDRTRRIKLDTQLFLAISLLFLFSLHHASRFAEYYSPFAVLTAGLLLRDAGFPWRSLISARIATVMLTTLLVIGAWQGISAYRKPPFFDLDQYGDVVKYIQEHGSTGDMIFNANPSDFVMLVPQLPTMRFVTGLDGTFLAYGDTKRFQIWYDLTVKTDRLKDQDTGKIIAETFGAKWAVIEYPRKALIEKLMVSKYAILRAKSQKALLFEIHLPKGTTANEIEH